MGQYCIVIPEKETVIAITSVVYDMGKVMNIVWEELLPAIQTNPIKEDATALGSLQQKTANLKLPLIKGDQRTKISRKASKKKYTLQANEEGVTAIDFDLHKNPPTITIHYDQEQVIIPIGQQHYQKSTLKHPLPYGKKLQKKVAANGAWISPTDYQLRMYFYEMPERITYTFSFAEDQVTWESKLEHSLLGPQEQERFIGNRD